MFYKNENDFRTMDSACREAYGKGVADTTIAEIQSMILALTPAKIDNAVTVADQIDAALRDTEECNCSIHVPRTTAGEMDLAGARPVHTCVRA